MMLACRLEFSIQSERQQEELSHLSRLFSLFLTDWLSVFNMTVCYVNEHVHTVNAHVYGGQRSIISVLLCHFSPYFLKQDLVSEPEGH